MRAGAGEPRRVFLARAGLAAAALAGATPSRGAEGRFRLGIVGSQNTHSERFAERANLDGPAEERVHDAIVTHLWGEEPGRTREVAERTKIGTIVASPAEMIGKVDGVICVRRHGRYHLEDAMPFIEAGMPVFVDKPLTCDVEEARRLVDAAQRAGIGFSSFSSLRHSAETESMARWAKEASGGVVAGSIAGPCDPNSEYGGIFFYGIHSVELLHTVFGYGVEEVRAVRHGNAVAVTCALREGPLVTLNLVHEAKSIFHVAAFGRKEWMQTPIDSGAGYLPTLRAIVETLRTGKWPLTAEQLVAPIRVLAAIEASLASGETVRVM